MGKGFKKNTVAQVMRLKKLAYNDHHLTKNITKLNNIKLTKKEIEVFLNNCIPLHMSVYNNYQLRNNTFSVIVFNIL